MVMTIGQVASGAGVNIQTVRYYERRGRLPRAPRTASGYRQYDPDAVARLRFTTLTGFTAEVVETREGKMEMLNADSTRAAEHSH